MFKKDHRSGLRTIFFPSSDNQSDKITLNFVFATPIKFPKDKTENTKDICHTFSPSHLIEHSLIEQNEKSFYELDQKYNATMENAFTCYNLTYYILHINDTRYIKEAINTTLHNLMQQKAIDKDVLLHELEIIKHEFKDDYFYVDEETIMKNKNDLLEKPKINKKELEESKEKEKEEKIEKELINKIVSKLEDDKKITSFYKKHYTPENTIITVDGGNKKTYSEIVSAIDVFFQNYPLKAPNTYDFSEEIYEDEIKENLFEKDDEFYDKLFSKKYYIFSLKDKEASYSETRVYFKIPKNKKFVLATKLLMSIAYRQIATSTILVKNLRKKEKLVYSVKSNVDIVENSHKYALNFTFKTESKNIKIALNALRDTINEMATTRSFNTNDFAREKQNFAKQYYDDEKYYFFEGDFEDKISLVYSNQKLNSIERDVRLIQDLKFEDIVNVAKFLSKNNQFTVQCFGNNISLSDLEIFSKNIQNPYSKKDLDHFFGGNEKINEYENEKSYDAKNEDDEDAPVLDLV